MIAHPGLRVGPRGGSPCRFSFEGRDVAAWPGETVAAALLAAGIRDLRIRAAGEARGPFCAVGACWECRCVIDGEPNRRACVTEARPGMRVERQRGLE